MKALLCALLVALVTPQMVDAAAIRISGMPSWKIKNPDCTFKLTGSLENLSTSGTVSGTLKMILWATAVPFPSKGYPIAEHTLGQLAGGYQINSFTAKAPAFVPKVSGEFYFTISIVEFTTAGWLTRAYVDTGKMLLENGEFVTGFKWVLPNKPVIAPPARLAAGDELALTLKATAKLSMIPMDSQVRFKAAIKTWKSAAVTASGSTSPAIFNYSVTNGSLNGKSVRVGRLFLDYAKAAGSTRKSNSTITLFFQGPSSGVYKHVAVSPEGANTSWGIFAYR